MIDMDGLGPLAQYGLAGLMGVLWLMERRSSTQRERELSEAHRRMMAQHEEIGELMDVVRDNTSAVTRLEQSQARLITVCEHILARLEPSAGRRRGPFDDFELSE
ncbi:MAG: hypothetical protein D8M59_05840 [Planctomycetes bacterium]|nr:hypothetical protein [Planctomycetota bacterium]NOG55896.1 hypothetical protein [Planctomycetota bacterium]